MTEGVAGDTFLSAIFALPAERRQLVSQPISALFPSPDSTSPSSAMHQTYAEINSACIYITPNIGTTIGRLLDANWTKTNLDKLVLVGHDLMEGDEELTNQ